MSDVKFSKEHEWVIVDGDVATIGITNHAQEQLGDIVFVELPEVGDDIEADGTAGTVESVKAASDIFTPVSGEVVEINENLESAPESVNADAEGDAWLFKVKLSDASELDALMSEADYKAFIAD